MVSRLFRFCWNLDSLDHMPQQCQVPLSGLGAAVCWVSTERLVWFFHSPHGPCSGRHSGGLGPVTLLYPCAGRAS